MGLWTNTLAILAFLDRLPKESIILEWPSQIVTRKMLDASTGVFTVVMLTTGASI